MRRRYSRAGGAAVRSTAPRAQSARDVRERGQGRRSHVHHVNGASAEKYLVETMGSGAAFLDYDNDGWIDLFVVDGGSSGGAGGTSAARHRLFHNEGLSAGALARRATLFTDVTAGVGHPPSRVRDGRVRRRRRQRRPHRSLRHQLRPQRAVSERRQRRVHRRHAHGAGRAAMGGARAARSWTSIATAISISSSPTTSTRRRARTRSAATRSAASACTATRSTTRACRACSIATTARASSPTSAPRPASPAHVGNGLGVAVGDYDDDGWPDVFVANDAVPNFLFHNDGQRPLHRSRPGRRRRRSARDGKPRAGMGTEFADYNGDGRLDLVVTNHEFETHSLFRNDGKGSFSDATVESGHRAADAAVRRIRRRVLRRRQRRHARPRDRQRTRHRQHRDVPARLDACAAQAAVSQHERPALRRSEPAGRAGVRRRRRSDARWSPATSTTTATWICSSRTTVGPLELLRNNSGSWQRTRSRCASSACGAIATASARGSRSPRRAARRCAR